MIDPSQYIYGYKFKDLPGEIDNCFYADTHDTQAIQIVFQYAGYSNDPITLITHNSDWPVSKFFESTPLCPAHIPSNLVWYSTNVDIVHPNICSIPIGLENPEWHRLINKPNKIYEIAKENEAREKIVIVNAMFNPNTHPRRTAIYDNFKRIPGAVCELTINGSMFNTYATIVSKSYLTVCPRGNGIDTHRFWEALYLGSVPLVETCINVTNLDAYGVPMVVSSDLTKIDREAIDWAIATFWPNDFNETLTMDYWINKIRNRA